MTTPVPSGLVTTVPTHGARTLALTFDDGPDPVHTLRLLDVLAEHEVLAVFCLWGDHVREHPEVVRRVVAAGHVLGNHSMHHDDLGEWEAEAVRADLTATARLIAEVAPGVPVPWFRAPYGRWGAGPVVAAELGMRSLAWDVVVGDWEEPGAEELVRRVREAIRPGAVVLLHDAGGDRSGTVDAVARLLPELLDDGWRFVLPDPEDAGRGRRAGAPGPT